MTEPYDSTQDTREHITQVRKRMNQVITILMQRSLQHDASKLLPPEKEAFDRLTPRLKELKYGSEEYKASLREMKPAIEHHYAKNSHHPEHFHNLCDGMTLLDLLEMLCDWGAAQQRHNPPGTFNESMAINVPRFKILPQLESILRNTINELGW